ncbi:GNAT family N-acetyltransferase [Cohaesibacter haloalkalitolerans]|uniref:GNAT family N-acetyltransferase n=1 Tax=Cohaesibacter haloalkalitolerans TaxID=1162980 RepID=UPI000E6577B3|nr:GNAT family N-acetyltransferase [Cohaesibacter haloalkalitolerans]
MTPDIRPYVTEKAEEFCAFLKQSWLDTYGPEVGRAATDGLIASMLGNGIKALVPGRDETACLAEQGSRIVGSIIHAQRQGFVYVWGLYVARQKQRMGIGQALLSHALKDCHDDLIVEVSVLVASRKARAFYDKLGFRQVAEECFEMGAGNFVPSGILQAPVSTIRKLYTASKPLSPASALL